MSTRDATIAFLQRNTGAEFDLCDALRELVRSFAPSEVGDVGAAADLILDACKDDAHGKTGRVRFELVATKEGKRAGRHAISIDAGAGTLGQEDATIQGVLIECLRDKRDVMRMAFAHREEIDRRQDQMLALFHQQAAKSEEQRIKTFEVLEELISHKAERDLATRKADMEHRSTARMMEAFAPLIPAAANRLLGTATGTTAPLGPEMLGEFLRSFSVEQLAEIATKMNPMQQAAFFEIVELADKAKADQIKRDTANGIPPAEPDVSNSPGGVG